MIVASCICICIRTWGTVYKYFLPTSRYHVLGTKSLLSLLRKDGARRVIDRVDLSSHLPISDDIALLLTFRFALPRP